MSTKRLAVWGFVGLVSLQWVALSFVLILLALLRGGHPEALHGVFSAALLYLFFGSPMLLITGLMTRMTRRLRKNPFLVRALWASAFVCVAVWSICLVLLATASLRT